MPGGHRACRSENFGVRRWLQLGAASAGVSAALFGLSLAGPQVGVALADDSGSSSSDSGQADSNQSDSASDLDSGGASAGGADQHTSSMSTVDSGPRTSVGSGRTEDADDTVSDDTDDTAGEESDVDTDSESEADDTDTAGPVIDTKTVEPTDTAESTPKSSSSDHKDAVVASATTASVAAPADSLVADSEPMVVETDAAEPDSGIVTAAADPDIPWALQVGATTDPRKPFISQAITAWTSDSLAWIDSLPLPAELKWHMEGALWTVRRSFLNLAPTVAPMQVTGQSSGPITGRVDAVDPEGDRIVYRVVKAPTQGNLEINGDGTFTYTPGDDFDGVDSFVVMAQDLGLHVNLLDVFRGAGTAAGALVNQGAIKFAFNYTTGSQYWTPERRAALNASANAAAAYLMVTTPVLLTYKVTGEDSPESTTLAAAYSELVSTSPGFWGTVVQNKLISGVDANGAEADGEIDWNFDSAWALGDFVDSDEYDFRAVAIHELMHSFGFSSRLRPAGENWRDSWTVFASFIVTADGKSVIDEDYLFNTDYNDYLTGGHGGLYFGGANAIAAYGGLVPLFTPDPWESGSSMGHLDDATFTDADQKLMNAKTDSGPGVRVLSPIELGILADLGYIVVIPRQPTPAAAMINA